MRKYIEPTIKVKHIELEGIMAASEFDSTPSIKSVVGLTDDDTTPTPSIGGVNDGSHSVGAKQSMWSSWDEEE